MKIVRNQVFETNSSSSHSISILQNENVKSLMSLESKWKRKLFPIMLTSWEYGYDYEPEPIPIAIGFQEKLSYLLSGCFEEVYTESQERCQEILDEFNEANWYERSKLLMKFCLSSKSGKLLNDKMLERGFDFRDIENCFFIEGGAELCDIGVETSLMGSPTIYSLVEDLDNFLFNDLIVIAEG